MLLGREQANFEKKDPSALPNLQKMLVSLPDVEKSHIVGDFNKSLKTSLNYNPNEDNESK